jgi:GntR family transcriptional regulator
VLNKNSHIPLYLQIQALLRDKIHGGNMPPGSQIPSEIELASDLAVSRMTVRKAIEGLVARGDLFRRPGKGTFVASAVMTYGFSTMLSFSRTLAARGFAVSTQVLRHEVVPGSPHVCAQLSLQPGSEVLIIRRLRSVNGEPVAIHTSYFDHRVFGSLRKYDLVGGSLLEAMEKIYGAHMASTRDMVRAASANPEDGAVLGHTENMPVLVVEGTAYDARGIPTRHTEAVYRGDRFELVVVNTHGHASSLAMTEESAPLTGERR